jgi:hypothetical protein
MKVTNQNVIRAWVEGRAAINHRVSLSCNEAGALHSYGLKIGQRLEGGRCVVAQFTAVTKHFRSVTTSTHVNLAARYADLVMHPLVWETSPLYDAEIPF